MKCEKCEKEIDADKQCPGQLKALCVWCWGKQANGIQKTVFENWISYFEGRD